MVPFKWLEFESAAIAGFLALDSEFLVRNNSVCRANVEVVTFLTSALRSACGTHRSRRFPLLCCLVSRKSRKPFGLLVPELRASCFTMGRVYIGRK